MRTKMLSLCLGLTALSPLHAQGPVPLSDLIKRVNIPYEQFTLPNGLRVVVHTDRKAPVVAVAVWYHIGSKDEPAGRSGFAHLFEHLMFAGAEHAKGSVIEQYERLGATELNGTTWYDRTNYYATVPTGALDRALFIESDRMGYLLPTLTQAQLDIQRGVVQNEKRRGDNQPYAFTEYAEAENLFPDGHPFHHTTIGSMADLDAAAMGDVRKWFHEHYGPNNAVLVMSGDIDLATAKAKAARWFGEIPRGPDVVRPNTPVPTLPAPKTVVLKDQVALTRITREWAVPGTYDADSVPLDLAASILGGLASSRFNDVLVRKQQVAVSESAGNSNFEKIGIFSVSIDVKPGVDPAKAGAALDAVVADFLAKGPTASEVQRAATREVEGKIKQFESTLGKAQRLGADLTYANDAGYYRKTLQALASATPEQVHAVARKWLTRPALTIMVEPGTRPAYAEPAAATKPAPVPDLPPSKVSSDRATGPEVGTLASLSFPAIERTTLSNGIPVIFAKRGAVPTVAVTVSFDAGYAADSTAQLGAQSLMLQAMMEGSKTRTAQQIAEESEALGARISTGASMDFTSASLTALTPNLGASLDLFGDIVLHPAFNPADVMRLRAQQLAAIDADNKAPQEPAARNLAQALYGPNHPYGRSESGSGLTETVTPLTPADLDQSYHRWLRPDTAQIFVVGDTDLSTIKPLLEARFGGWAAATGAKPVKDFTVATPAPAEKIVLVDRPNSPQSYILSGQLLPGDGREDILALRTANDVLGGAFSSRINNDLREQKAWSYGTYSFVRQNVHTMSFANLAEVQWDKTGPSVAAIKGDIADFLAAKGVTSDEFARTISSAIRGLPGQFETTDAVMGGVQNIIRHNFSDDYYVRLADRYRALTPAQLDAAARAKLDAGKMVYVIVGDATKVQPQLTGLGIKIETGK